MTQSESSAPAGCGVGLDSDAAGCETLESSDLAKAEVPPAAAGESAGCAIAQPADADEATATTPPATVRELERALRRLGFTRTQAEGIARHGFKAAQAAPTEGDVSDTSAAVHDDLRALAAALKGFT